MEGKRKTLGGLTTSQLNARASLVPAKLVGKLGKLSLGAPSSVIGSKAPVTSGIPSRLIPSGTGATRRSSTYGKPTSGLKSDPRPVNDKGFQGNCVRYLIAYLSTHGFDQPISPKMLASPMSKDFTAIVQFLIRQVDPNCNPKLFGKIEDDVPTFFKRLRYPFQISKSSLFAVGSPVTWPTLLASLVWITELLSYAEKAEHAKVDLEGEQRNVDAQFFDFVAEQYRYFLAGDDNGCEQVYQQRAAEVQERHAFVQDHNKLLHKENEGLQAMLSDLTSNPSPREVAQTKHEEHAADQEKFKKLIANLQSNRGPLQAKLQEKQADVRSRSEEVAQLEKDCKQLEERIAAQPYSSEDVARMNSEKVKQEDVLMTAETLREGLQGRVQEQESSLEQGFHSLEGNLQVYNASADKLQLIPPSAKRAGGNMFEAKLKRTGSSMLEVINVDLKGGVKTALARIRESCNSRERELNEETLILQERLDSLNDSLTERTEENATLNTQVHKADRQLTETKEQREREIRSLQAEAEHIKDEDLQLRSATSHGVADSVEKLHRLQILYEEETQGCEVERVFLNKDIEQALHAAFEHKAYMSDLIQTTHAKISEATSQALTMIL